MAPATDTITRWGVVIFPGSNCDKDALHAVGHVLGQNAKPVWHRDDLVAPPPYPPPETGGGALNTQLPETGGRALSTQLPETGGGALNTQLPETGRGIEGGGANNLDAIVLPGGFSYGDYLRAGAIARFAPVMEKIINFAYRGGLVIGICNGFQILTEAGLLPGVLLRNEKLRFICREVYLRVETTDTPFTCSLEVGQVIKMPIAHNEGNFFLPPDQISDLESNRQVVFRYCDSDGNITPDANPNGSINNIAGVVNNQRNVLGMMPHPERRCDPILGDPDGVGVFRSVIDFINNK